MEGNAYPEQDARYHAVRIKSILGEIANHARKDVSKTDDPRPKALFETTAEVLLGLIRAYDHFIERREQAWR
jgi:hypothetical protein